MCEDWKNRSIEATVASRRGYQLELVTVRNKRVVSESYCAK